MYNYDDFEANVPTDKASVKVLLNDYFHNSPITAIHILPEVHALELQLQCCREWEADSSRAELSDEKYTYILTFGSLHTCDIRTRMKHPIFISGRFKAIPRGKYYYRIATADGFIDIGYRSFSLRKASGRVSYRRLPAPVQAPAAISAEEAAWIRARIRAEVYLEEEDADLLRDLERLYASGRIDAENLRHCLCVPWHSVCAKPYAAWLLGKFGGREDLPRLWQYLSECSDPAIRRNLQDAIDTIEAKSADN